MEEGQNSIGQLQQTLQLLLIVGVWFNASSTHLDENKGRSEPSFPGSIYIPFTAAKRNFKTSSPLKCAQQP